MLKRTSKRYKELKSKVSEEKLNLEKILKSTTKLKALVKDETPDILSEKSKDLFIEVDESKARTFLVPAGTLIVFSSLTPHASGSNNSSSPRTAFLAQFSSEIIIDPSTGLKRNRAVPI